MKNRFYILTFFLFTIGFSQNIDAQCFEIESILVDACGADEGLNEMVRFKVGNAPLNVQNLNVTWANVSNKWTGVIQNSETKAIVDGLNANILAAGGCGKLIEPKNDILPANTTVILITSYVFDITLNTFGALTEDYYVIFQNNSTVKTGHFANTGSGIRYLSMNFGNGCTDDVDYDRSKLLNAVGGINPGDGATVVYTPNGNATYVNYGCAAPIPPFTVNAGTDVTICNAQTISLSGVAEGFSSIKWSATSGTFSDDTSLTSKYTIDANDVGKTIVLTLTASNSCKKSIISTIHITITKVTEPVFTIPTTLCSGSTAPVLKLTSDNGIVGTWNPSTINNIVDGVYIFTPNANQCASNYKQNITISNGNKAPNFTDLSFCNGSVLPKLEVTSPNGILGTWNPSVISTTSSGNYVFTPNSGQCATNQTIKININPAPIVTVKNETICQGGTVNVTASVSPPGNYNYVWTVPAGVTNPGNVSSFSTSTAGAYSVLVNQNPNLCNLSFEDKVTGLNTGSYIITDKNNVACWNTTATDGKIEVWSNGNLGVNAYVGNQFAELNANQASTLYQNINVIPGTNATVSFAHRGRNGTDVMSVEIGPVGGPYESLGNFSASNTNWVYNSVAFTFPNNSSNNYSIRFKAISTANGNISIGNFLDEISVTTILCQTNATANLTVNPTNGTPNFTDISFCEGSVAPILNNTSPNGIIGTWSPTIINNTTSGTYLFTPNDGQCATNQTITVTVSKSNKIPNFTDLSFCEGSVAPILNNTSPNGIIGTWSPTLINNNTSGTYLFTPNDGQCSANQTIKVVVDPSKKPNFDKTLTLCKNDVSPILATSDSNGLNGSWIPSTIDNTQSGTYLFTPNNGQCSSNHTLEVTVISTPIIPDFTTTLNLCSGQTAPLLENTSPNNISGSWTPNTIDILNNGAYVFTPNSAQCALPTTLTVSILNKQTPEFDFGNTKTNCNGDISTQVLLPITSKNNIGGTWKPNTIDNSKIGNTLYTFTPSINSCANNFDFTVTVIEKLNPTFDAILPICSGASLSLPTSSKEGYLGYWTPQINNSKTTTYTFQPNETCSNTTTLEVIVNPIPQASIVTVCDFDELKLVTKIDDNIPTTYHWSNLLNANLGTTNSLVVTQIGSYTVDIMQQNCNNSFIYNVNPSDFCSVQKGISTNNDGSNESFDLSRFQVKKLQIFNRYGFEVYSKPNYVNEWKGTSTSGEDLPDGTYYYIIKLENETIKSGWIYKTK